MTGHGNRKGYLKKTKEWMNERFREEERRRREERK